MRVMWELLVFLPCVLGGCGVGGGKCDEWSPCCSEHGFCGRDYAACGLGCQTNGTYDDGKGTRFCLLPPACQNRNDRFDDGSRVVPREMYEGDYRQVDWVATGKYSMLANGIEMIMPKGSGGARITSTRYVQFGKITARIRITPGAGVVTNFITMADDFDEIDWEWVGSDPNSSQSNFYSKGIKDFTNGMAHGIEGAHAGFHDYSIIWTPDLIQWSIDGNLVRTVERKDSRFPSSPSRIEIGLWDGGSGSKGTSDWAGGKIDWDAPEVASKGHFSIMLQSINIECTGNPTSSDSDFALTFQKKPNFTITANQIDHHSTIIIKGKQNTSSSLSSPLLPLPIIILISYSSINTHTWL